MKNQGRTRANSKHKAALNVFSSRSQSTLVRRPAAVPPSPQAVTMEPATNEDPVGDLPLLDDAAMTMPDYGSVMRRHP